MSSAVVCRCGPKSQIRASGVRLYSELGLTVPCRRRFKGCPNRSMSGSNPELSLHSLRHRREDAKTDSDRPLAVQRLISRLLLSVDGRGRWKAADARNPFRRTARCASDGFRLCGGAADCAAARAAAGGSGTAIHVKRCCCQWPECPREPSCGCARSRWTGDSGRSIAADICLGRKSEPASLRYGPDSVYEC